MAGGADTLSASPISTVADACLEVVLARLGGAGFLGSGASVGKRRLAARLGWERVEGREDGEPAGVAPDS